MTKTAAKTQQDRLRYMVLARLLPTTKRPPSRAAVTSSVAECLTATPQRMASSVETALDRCIAEGLVAAKPLALTASGRQALCAALGIDALPAPKNWAQVRRDLLVNLSLARGRQPTPRSADQLAAAILTGHHKLPTEAPTLRAAVDRLAWRALGVETDAPFDAARVQRHLLRDIVAEDVRVDTPTWRRMLAVRAVGARRGDAAGLRQGLVERWAQGTESERDDELASTLARSDNDNAKNKPTLAELARAVTKAAREPGVARFHDDRAFIGSIWEHMRNRAPVNGMSLADFKAQLVAAHRANLLRITRADLVGAMDPDEVERSEASYMGATFHFVALDAVGAR